MRRLVLMTLLALAPGLPAVAAPPSPPPEPDLEVFLREGCPRCEAAQPFLEELRRERPSLVVVLRDVGRDPAALTRLQALAAARGTTAGVPAFALRGEFLVGFAGAETTGRLLRHLLDAPGTGPGPPDRETIETGWFGPISPERLGLPLFTVALGLLDGFNPCAMWVLLFLLSLLVNLHDRAKMLTIAGAFVLASGLVYFAFMAAWLNLFLLIGLSRPIELLLGLVAIAIGAINVRDVLVPSGGPSLAIPESAKPGLYARVRRILQAEHLAGAVGGVLVLAFLVNVVELLCTAGFPALYTGILAARHLPWWEYYGYLALYNVAYILDDGLMVAIAVVTLGRRRLQEREGRWLKLISGTVMLALGVLLLMKPEWLH